MDGGRWTVVHAVGERGARAAAEAYAGFARFLDDELAPAAPTADGVGRERYALASRGFIGVEVDLEETYAWGVEELARMVADARRVAALGGTAGPGGQPGNDSVASAAGSHQPPERTRVSRY